MRGTDSLGNDGAVFDGRKLFDPAPKRLRVGEPEGTNRRTLEVMTLLTGLDQGHPRFGSKDRDRDARESCAGTEVSQRSELREHREQGCSIEDEPAGDLLRAAIGREIHPLGPVGEQRAELEEIFHLLRGGLQTQLREALREDALGGRGGVCVRARNGLSSSRPLAERSTWNKNR